MLDTGSIRQRRDRAERRNDGVTAAPRSGPSQSGMPPSQLPDAGAPSPAYPPSGSRCSAVGTPAEWRWDLRAGDRRGSGGDRRAMAFSLPAAQGRGSIGLAVVIGLAAAALLALPGGTVARPGSSAGWEAGTYSRVAEGELVARTDATRQAAGDGPLVVDAVLADLARWRSRDMVERAYFSHDIPDV